MREIIFRGKIKRENGVWKRGDWVFGPFTHIEDGGIGSAFIYGKGEVFEETVGQYTGLDDKNGKKIFEGDIVKILFEDGTYEAGAVVWSDANARYKFHSPDGAAYGIDRTVCMEIIGNIHDNPELLKGGVQG